MIPTLSGRLQTRLILFVLIGIPVTLLFAWGIAGWMWNLRAVELFLLFLVTITGLGLLLDPIYIFIQTTRWDRDWPFAYQLFFSWIEFGIVFALARAGLIPWLEPAFFQGSGGLWTAVSHFALVFVPSFLFLLGPLQVLFVRWRFKGGQLGRM